MSAGTTIFALSSGRGQSGIAVWRISGPEAGIVLDQLAGRRGKPRYAVHRDIRSLDGQIIDDGIALWLPGPGTATGEDMAEVHLHGSVAVSRVFTDVLIAMGLRVAEPGEFSRRAFLNGKADLLQLEGLGDLLDAETPAQHAQAMAIRGGLATELVDEWRRELTAALAHLEAAIDFPDEDDIPVEIAQKASPAIRGVIETMSKKADESAAGGRLRSGLTLAIVGPPNAGKSSLLNALLRENRAIVSDIPGTTRDFISETVEIRSQKIRILDTAGIRLESKDSIEIAGIEKSREVAETADIVLHVWPVDAPSKRLDVSTFGGKVIDVPNKADLISTPPEHAISVVSGAGLDKLEQAIGDVIETISQPALFPRERQRSLLILAVGRLRAAIDQPNREPELVGEDVRAAIGNLESLIGMISPDDVLDEVFGSFCIGK